MAIKAGLRWNPRPAVRYNPRVSWIYLSPHFDDAALSCGGLAWQQSQADEIVSIWTICAGEPSPGELSSFALQLHARWEAGQNAPAIRKAEDIASCRRLGASYRHFSIPDCIYRRDPRSGEFMYAAEAALTGPLQPGDSQIVHALSDELCRSLPEEADVVCPLALGAHVDHQLTRLAAEQLGRVCWFYADFPYVLSWRDQLEQLKQNGWDSQLFAISPLSLLAWQESIAAHASQISTFWENVAMMRQAVSQYLYLDGGLRLWKKPPK